MGAETFLQEREINLVVKTIECKKEKPRQIDGGEMKLMLFKDIARETYYTCRPITEIDVKLKEKMI